MNDPVLFAYEIGTDAHGRRLEGEHVGKLLKDDQLAWVHLDATHPECSRWLEQTVSYLDPIIREALMADETRPRALEFGTGILLILRGVNLNEGAAPEDMVSIRLWIDQHRIVSVQRRQLQAVNDIREKLEEGKGPKNPGQFLGALVTRLFERIEPVLLSLDERVDNAEEEILDAPDTFLRQKLTEIRRQAILLRRYIAPQKEAVNQLRTSELEWIDTGNRRLLLENVDRAVRFVEDLDMIRERAQIIKDEFSNTQAERLNRNLYFLSVVAAIFLPLGFLTGLLGINVGGIPGTEYKYAFWIVSGLLVLISILQIMLFRRLKWL